MLKISLFFFKAKFCASLFLSSGYSFCQSSGGIKK
ncbi:hypothetical protein BH24BAC1_BH24BAC1_10510 [soil metagenome]